MEPCDLGVKRFNPCFRSGRYHKAAETLNLSTNSLLSKENAVIFPAAQPKILSSPGSDPIAISRMASIYFFCGRALRKRHEGNFMTVYEHPSFKGSGSGKHPRIRGEESPGKRQGVRRDQGFLGGTEIPVFDLIILGMGEDGHTASLFPGSETLREKTRLAVPVYKERGEIHRVTLTLPVLNNAAQVVFLK
jgi:hypothetical protein